MDIWKDVEGYKGIYEVSNTGKVRTVEGKTTHSERCGKRKWKLRELKLKTDRGGYKRVCLYKNKIPKDFLVHRLVANAFCEKGEDQMIINHKDCDPSNNNVENLEWCTYRDNLIHAFKNGLNKSPKKVILISKYTGENKPFNSYREASEFLGKNKGYISGILKRNKTETDFYKIRVC
jgi:hypothetical protein